MISNYSEACMSCVIICQTGAVDLELSKEGFWKAKIDQAKYIGCEKCEKVCPVDLLEC